jgi:hypothetical protein
MESSTSKNQHFRDVHVVSSRHPTRIFRCEADSEVCAIAALRTVADSLLAPEPGEHREIKTFLEGNNGFF